MVALAESEIASRSLPQLLSSNGVPEGEEQRMIFVEEARDRIFAAIETAMVLLVLTVLLGSALFNTVLNRRPSQIARENDRSLEGRGAAKQTALD